MTERSRELRKSMTEAERLLWWALRKRRLDGVRFRRQHPIGPYVVDFVCLERTLLWWALRKRQLRSWCDNTDGVPPLHPHLTRPSIFSLKERKNRAASSAPLEGAGSRVAMTVAVGSSSVVKMPYCRRSVYSNKLTVEEQLRRACELVNASAPPPAP